MRRSCLVLLVAMLASGASACASKKFVRSGVGATNAKVNEMIGSLEEIQVRTGRHERRIAEVDARSGAAARAAEAAYGVAAGASTDARAAGLRLEAMDRAGKRLVYDVASSSAEANFPAGGAELPEAAKVRIDRMMHQLADDPQNIYIEIEGHTDDRGPSGANMKVGLARAQAVQRYLYDVHQIPLHKMQVISFGEDRPVSSNRSETGRAQNRRVVIRIRA